MLILASNHHQCWMWKEGDEKTHTEGRGEDRVEYIILNTQGKCYLSQSASNKKHWNSNVRKLLEKLYRCCFKINSF